MRATMGHDSRDMCAETAPAGRVGVIVLAAGAATRFGAPKQRILLPHVLARVAEAAVGEIVVVEGAYPLGTVTGARVVRASEWDRGPGASLRAGLSALSVGMQAAVVLLADGPRISPGAIDRVLMFWRESPGVTFAASYGGVRGHPVVLGRSSWATVPDRGLRDLPAQLVPCDDLGSPEDVDTPADLERLGLGEE